VAGDGRLAALSGESFRTAIKITRLADPSEVPFFQEELRQTNLATPLGRPKATG